MGAVTAGCRHRPNLPRTDLFAKRAYVAVQTVKLRTLVLYT